MATQSALLLLTVTYLTLGWAKELTDPFILGIELESGFNDQVMIEYEAFYIYENMAAYFSRPEVGLHGFAKFFRKAADEEIEHARKVSDFINKRNGRVILRHIVPSGLAGARFRCVSSLRVHDLYSFSNPSDTTINSPLYTLFAFYAVYYSHAHHNCISRQASLGA
ncbi:hypothetical protein AHF37_02114 [Paragonimus kellicotti]|nr:hypothetical protein AHF37_02114 [Paragonimus kellicotti]